MTLKGDGGVWRGSRTKRGRPLFRRTCRPRDVDGVVRPTFSRTSFDRPSWDYSVNPGRNLCSLRLQNVRVWTGDTLLRCRPGSGRRPLHRMKTERSHSNKGGGDRRDWTVHPYRPVNTSRSGVIPLRPVGGRLLTPQRPKTTQMKPFEFPFSSLVP